MARFIHGSALQNDARSILKAVTQMTTPGSLFQNSPLSPSVQHDSAGQLIPLPAACDKQNNCAVPQVNSQL